jgi:hypothetical protein
MTGTWQIRIILIIFSLFILNSIYNAGVSVFDNIDNITPSINSVFNKSLVLIIFSIFLCYKLFNGSNYARLSLGILSLIGIIISLIVLLTSDNNQIISQAVAIILLNSFVAFLLLFSKSLRKELKKRVRSGENSSRGRDFADARMEKKERQPDN